MKHIALAAALLTMSTCHAPAHAVDPSQVQVCVEIGNLAAVVMTSRQQGVSYAELYASAVRGDDRRVNAIATLMVKQAFEIPRYQSNLYRSEAVQNFRNLWEKTCIEELGFDA